MVYVVGVSQSGSNLPALKASLESWLQDSAFWTDMSSYVSGFYQEVYGDVRELRRRRRRPSDARAIPERVPAVPRRSSRSVGPASTATARAYLSTAFGPLANASWAFNTGYGYTNVGSDVMADYVSAETYAMRAAGNPNIGFAWNSPNPDGLDASDFSTQTSGILIRLAGAIHETDGGDPAQACEATGCSAVIDGGTAATGWSTFSTWAPTVGAFTTPVQTLTPRHSLGTGDDRAPDRGRRDLVAEPDDRDALGEHSGRDVRNRPERAVDTDAELDNPARDDERDVLHRGLRGDPTDFDGEHGRRADDAARERPRSAPPPVALLAARVGSVTIDQVGDRLRSACRSSTQPASRWRLA